MIKVYKDDLIKAVVDVPEEGIVKGETYVVQGMDEDIETGELVAVTTQCYKILVDGEYEVEEYLSKESTIDKLNKYLELSNGQLLSKFKWGSEGEGEFSSFMRLVRHIVND